MEFFASAEVVQRFLFGGDQYWIEIKQELTAGEERKLALSGMRRVTRAVTDDQVPGIELDLEAAAFTKVALYLHDWNLTDKAGKSISIRDSRAKADALRALKPSVFAEIERVIDVEVEARVSGKPIDATGSSAPSGN